MCYLRNTKFSMALTKHRINVKMSYRMMPQYVIQYMMDATTPRVVTETLKKWNDGVETNGDESEFDWHCV